MQGAHNWKREFSESVDTTACWKSKFLMPLEALPAATSESGLAGNLSIQTT
jgi:hypothetical protein